MRRYGIADSPGTLTVTADLTNDDADPGCTVSGTVNFEIKAATAPIVSKLRKPPAVQGTPRLAVGLELLVLGQAGADG